MSKMVKKPVSQPSVIILDLSDRCFNVLFNQISLMQQIKTLSLVCKRFRAVLIKKWSKEHNLQIFNMPIPLELYRERYRTYGSLHHFPQLCYHPARTITGPYKSVAKLITFVTNRFTRISELLVMFTEFSDAQFNLLINETLRGQLQLLAIFRDYEETWAGLFPILLKLRSLKHLIMFDVAESLTPLGPLFRRLETLHLTYFMNDLFRVVNLLGPAIRNLSLYAADFGQIGEVDKPRILPEIAKNLKYLTLDCCLLDYDHTATTDVAMVNYISNNFGALTEVDIPMGPGIKIETALRHLKSLSSLTTLHISFEDADPLINLTSDSTARALQMLNIRKLFIQKSLGKNGSTCKRLHYFGIIFPNLQYLNLLYCPLYCKKSHLLEPCKKCETELKKWVFESFENIRSFTVYSQKVQSTGYRQREVVDMNKVLQKVEHFYNPKFEHVIPLKMASISYSNDYVLESEDRAKELRPAVDPRGGARSASNAMIQVDARNSSRVDLTEPELSVFMVQFDHDSQPANTAQASGSSALRPATLQQNGTTAPTASELTNRSVNSTKGNSTSKISTTPSVNKSSSSSPLTPFGAIILVSDKILSVIFSSFSLQTKLTIISLVCKRWKAIVDEECRQLPRLHVFPTVQQCTRFFAMYHSLACFNTFQGLTVHNSELLVGQCRVSNGDFIRYLHGKFPKIRQLVLYCLEKWTEEDMVQILGSTWQYQLELFGVFMDPHQRNNFRWNLVYPAIRLAKKKLKHLILCDIGPEKPEGLKEVFAGLETLYIGYHGNDLFELVNGCGKKLRRLALFHPKLDSFTEDQLKVSVKSKVARHLEHLTLESGLFEMENRLPDRKILDFVVKGFGQLKVLDFAPATELKIDAILERLKKLPALRSLRLRIDNPQADPLANFTSKQFVDSSRFVLPKLQQLAIQNSVGPTGSVVNNFAILSHSFPGLEYLHLIGCPLFCKPAGNHSTEPCDCCDSKLLDVVSKRFGKLKRYRQMRYKEREVMLSSGNAVMAHEPQGDVWNFLKDGEGGAYFEGEEV